MNEINRIRNNDFIHNILENRKLTQLFPEFKKICNKKEYDVVCKIIQLLTDKNSKYNDFGQQRNFYIHEGISIFDYSDIELFYDSINFNEIIENFTSLYAIFCSFCLNYLFHLG